MALGIWGDIWGPIWDTAIWAPGGGGGTAPTVTILEGATETVAVGKVKLLTVSTTGDPAPSVSWASADEGVVTVNGSGAITGIAEGGPVNVTATAANGVAPDGTDVIAVTVTAAVTVSGSRTNRRKWRF